MTRQCRQCGKTGTYDSPSRADYAMRIHSCEKWTAKIAGQQRRAERLAKVDRTPKPCLHKVADHQHGTRAAYVLDKCRCHPCSHANADAETDRQRQKAYGRYDKYVPAAPVREHIRTLMAYGIGLKQVTRLTGINGGQLNKIMYGSASRTDGQPTQRVLHSTATRLEAIQTTPANLAPSALDPHRTELARTHLRALVALGWSQSRLAVRLGILPSNLAPVIGSTSERTLTRRLVDQIEALYAELSMTLPPASDHHQQAGITRARAYAKRHGWLPPLALDEDEAEVDDTADLDEVAILRRLAGDKTVRLTKAERAEISRRWIAQGRSANELELRAGIKPGRYVDIERSA